VAITHQDSYTDRLDQTLMDGLRLFNLDLCGKTVLLKPNLVESIPGSEVNTNPRLVGAAATAFLTLGVKTVLVGEGPGHQGDTRLVLAETGFETELRERRIRFVDLNRDEVVKVQLKTRFTGLEFLWLPRTVLASDFVVSMPKVKTHHWAGVTLSMKNLFGVVPGVAYGWPKNLQDYDAIVTLALGGRQLLFALEYERTPKSQTEYDRIVSLLERERNLDRVLYLAGTRHIRSLLKQRLWRIRQHVLIGLASDLPKTEPADLVTMERPAADSQLSRVTL
jgi:hypothetical protein